MAFKMDDHFYKQLNRILETELNSKDLPIEGHANPFLHLISEHPIHVQRYKGLYNEWRFIECGKIEAGEGDDTKNVNYFNLRKIINSAIKKIPKVSPSTELLRLQHAKVVIVSVLVKPEQLSQDDFYFGPLQRFFDKNNIRSILVYLNQSGTSEKYLRGSIQQSRLSKKIILPTVLSLYEELNILLRLFLEIGRVKKKISKTHSKLHRMVLKESISLKNIRETGVNLRIYKSMRNVCKSAKPELLMTLHEGHAWEKLSCQAARETIPNVRCIGYQHSVMRKKAYGLYRYIAGNRNMNHDAILALGSVSQQNLKEKIQKRNFPVYVYGSHRRQSYSSESPRMTDLKCVLVTPEGISSESLYLTNFTYHCSKKLPEYEFILRFHPALPFESLPGKLRNLIADKDNITVSKEREIKKDFSKAGYIIYRGSSTVLYAIIAGLKPFYININGAANIDPLFSLDVWRECIDTPGEFTHYIKATEKSEIHQYTTEWNKALVYCKNYIYPLSMKQLLDWL